MDDYNLAQFIGTENYYSNPFYSTVYTDGVKHVAETCGAYWLIDKICLEHPKHQPFLAITFSQGETPYTGLLSYSDGNEHLITYKIDFTDFPFNELSQVQFYLTEGVLMLRSEY